MYHPFSNSEQYLRHSLNLLHLNSVHYSVAQKMHLLYIRIKVFQCNKIRVIIILFFFNQPIKLKNKNHFFYNQKVWIPYYFLFTYYALLVLIVNSTLTINSFYCQVSCITLGHKEQTIDCAIPYPKAFFVHYITY